MNKRKKSKDYSRDLKNVFKSATKAAPGGKKCTAGPALTGIEATGNRKCSIIYEAS